jgi:hypothetical protein
MKSRHPAGSAARAHVSAGHENRGQQPAAELQNDGDLNGHALNGHRPAVHPVALQSPPARRAVHAHAYHRQSSKAAERRALDDMDE